MPVDQAHDVVTWGAAAMVGLSAASVLLFWLLKDKLNAIVKDNHSSNLEVRSAVKDIATNLDAMKETMSAHASRIAVGDQRAQEVHSRLSIVEAEVRGFSSRLENLLLELVRTIKGERGG